jgi:hypothetical protein
MISQSKPGKTATVRCSVELFGAARLLAKIREIVLDVPAPGWPISIKRWRTGTPFCSGG